MTHVDQFLFANIQFAYKRLRSFKIVQKQFSHLHYLVFCLSCRFDCTLVLQRRALKQITRITHFLFGSILWSFARTVGQIIKPAPIFFQIYREIKNVTCIRCLGNIIYIISE